MTKLLVAVKDVAKRKHWHLSDLAVEAGVTVPTMFRYWHGRNGRYIDTNLVVRLAEILQVSPKSLFIEVEVPDNEKSPAESDSSDGEETLQEVH